MKVAYLSNADRNTGIGLRVSEIGHRLQANKHISLDHIHLNGEMGVVQTDSSVIVAKKTWPGPLRAKSVMWVRLGRAILPRLRSYNLIHLTSQNLSFLARKDIPTVITVHDLIEIMEPQDWRAALLNNYLYSGLKRAKHIIAVSQYTKQTITERYGISKEDVSVIYNGVGQEFYHIKHFDQSVSRQTLRHELKLPDQAMVVLYVGSEHARKNISTALQAFLQASESIGKDKLWFIKVGNPGLAAGRAQTLSEIERLGIKRQVILLRAVSEQRLNELYNLADVLVYPSRFEGFGLPPLQAMAAGTPVITSNVTSLPEVVGGAAITHDPDDTSAFAKSIIEVLSDKDKASILRKKGLVRARQFSWDRAAQEIAALYHHLSGI